MNIGLCFGAVSSDLALYRKIRSMITFLSVSGVFGGIPTIENCLLLRSKDHTWVAHVVTSFTNYPPDFCLQEEEKKQNKMIYMRKSCCTRHKTSSERERKKIGLAIIPLYYISINFWSSSLITAFCTQTLCLFDFNLMIHRFTVLVSFRIQLHSLAIMISFYDVAKSWSSDKTFHFHDLLSDRSQCWEHF